MILKERPEWGELATFIPNKIDPIYNWFYYKEGFSKELVEKLFEKFKVKKNDLVLDPFCGVGTTPLACKQKGIKSIGFDVNPVGVFSSTAKTRNYNINELKGYSIELFEKRFQHQDYEIESPFIKKAFNRHTLDDVIFFRREINKLADESVRDFFLLALMNVTMKCSYVWKDGSVLKIKKHPVPPLRKLLKRQIHKMIKDLKRSVKTKTECTIDSGDARRLKIEDESIDYVITSPPYLNKIEYTKIYSIEEELFFRKVNKPAIRSFIGISNEKVLDQKGILDQYVKTENLPFSAVAYFVDMLEVIKELYRVCKKGGKVAMVVGNGCFPETVVDSDTVLSEIARKVGFGAKEILVLNKRWCTKNRVEKVGVTRESLLIWEK